MSRTPAGGRAKVAPIVMPTIIVEEQREALPAELPRSAQWLLKACAESPHHWRSRAIASAIIPPGGERTICVTVACGTDDGEIAAWASWEGSKPSGSGAIVRGIPIRIGATNLRAAIRDRHRSDWFKAASDVIAAMIEAEAAARVAMLQRLEDSKAIWKPRGR